MSIRIYVRRLLRSRVFLATAILVLGLGLGVNLILFNTAYALLWRPLHFPHADRLVTLNGRSNSGDLSDVITGQEAWTLRSQSQLISAFGVTGRRRLVTLLQGDEAIDLASAAVDSGYFRALELQPVAGRFFGAEEDLAESPEQPAILAESAWRIHFASDPSIVGRTLVVQQGGNRRPIRIIGVVSRAATLPFASDAEILLPIASASPAVSANFGDAWYHAVARLQPGVSVSHVSARADALLQDAASQLPFGSWGRHWITPLRTAVAPVKPTTILFLYSAACLLLLLTCANLASLFVARAMARTHETSVHLALGASRRRMLTAHFYEALLVCAAGAGLAFLIEIWARPLVPKFIPAVASVGPELLATGPVLLAFGILICLVVSLVVSVASGVRVHVYGLADTLAQGCRTGTSGSTGSLRAILSAGQVAIVLTLLTVSGMVGRSFISALRSNPGLNAQGVATFQLSLPGSQRAPLAVIATIADQVARIPGTKSVTFAAESPVGSPAFSTVTAARAGDLRTTDPMVAYRLIGPAYFETLGARMASGRTFSQDEVQQGRQLAILNEAAAHLLFPGETPIGRTVHSGIGSRRSVVVGVVKDIRTEGLDQAAAPMVYMPYFPGWGLRFIVRGTNSSAALLPLLRERMRTANPGALVQRFRPLDEMLDETVRERMVSGVLVGGFALLGLIISSVGLYGTLAGQVQQRRREIGVRIALGATMQNVVATVLSDGLRILALAGIAGSALAGRAIQHELYGVSPLDFTSFAVAIVLLGIAAVAACLIPAVRAGHVDPIQALNVQ